MMPVDEMREIVKSLLERTVSKQVPWRRDSAENIEGVQQAIFKRIPRPTSAAIVAYVTVLPQSIIRIVKATIGPDHEFIQFSFHLSDESILGSWLVSNEAEDWATADGLFTLIREQIGADWNLVISDVVSLNQTVGLAGDVGSFPQSTAFFRKVAGEWQLTWFAHGAEAGREDVRIDEVGNYYTKPREPSPYLWLRDVFYDAAKRHVTFAKIRATGLLKGKAVQTEVLEISEDGRQMSGYAQHDGHRLVYKRRSAAA
jgi:hypothetical protein